MLEFFTRKIGELLEHAERSRRDAYLASSSDIAELERRMRWIEYNGFPDGNMLVRPSASEINDPRTAKTDWQLW